LTVLIGVFIGGMLLGVIVGIILTCIFSFSRDLPDEDYPLTRRATDEPHHFTDEELAELRAIK
jgi:MFS superfamily sulfate permease-like transporter